jgi:biotin carboxyl carrier protein
MPDEGQKIWVTVEGERFLVEVLDLNQRPIIAIVEGSRFEIYPERSPGDPETETQSVDEVLQLSEKTHSIPAETICEVIAPMPGDISKILVKAGQSVQPGDPLCVLDAMKMKNTIHAPQSGIIQEVLAEEGQTVDHGIVLFRFS